MHFTTLLSTIPVTEDQVAKKNTDEKTNMATVLTENFLFFNVVQGVFIFSAGI